MLPQMRRCMPSLSILALLLVPASASATVTAEGVGAGVFLASDSAADTITLTCSGGMAPGGAATQIPCEDV